MKKIIIVVFILVLGLGAYLFLNLDKYSWLQNFISKEVVTKVQDIVSKITQPEFNQNLTSFINTNSDSNVAMVVKAENGEGLVAFTDENKVINKITIHTADGKSGIIQLDKSGLPTQLDFEGTIATFSNYTDTTVDITVNRADGTSQTFEKSAISPKSLSFIPTAMAYSISEYMSGIGTAMNVVGCGVGLGSILFSGGATSPLAYLGCASLTTRMITIDTEIGRCEGDVLDCAKDAILGSFTEGVQKYGPDFLKKGFRVKGSLKNSVTGSHITNGVIIVESKSTGKKLRGEWMPKSYEIYFKDPGVYLSRLVSEGFADSEFDIILAPTKAQVRIPGQQLALEKDFRGKDYAEMEMDFFIDPDAFIRGEIIDSKEGDSIKNAKVYLLDGTTKVDQAETESDGEFTVQPPLSKTGKNFTLQVSADKYEMKNIPIFISYEVKNKSDEYEIEDWNGVVKLTPKAVDFSDTQKEPVLESEENEIIGIWEGQMNKTYFEPGDGQHDRNPRCRQSTPLSFLLRVYKSPYEWEGKEWAYDVAFCFGASFGDNDYDYDRKRWNKKCSFASSYKLDKNGNFIIHEGGATKWRGVLSGKAANGTWDEPGNYPYEKCGGTWIAIKKQ